MTVGKKKPERDQSLVRSMQLPNDYLIATITV